MLTPRERQALKAQAHKLEPVVTIGGKGLTDAVLKEIDFALKSHELLKLRAPAMDRHERAAAFDAICERTGAEPVQHVGKVFVIYRKKPAAE
ncbi:MAG: YhbY family RNA-binding protein [Betaproteobacteria bacterium]|nr:YhbY family RNA-binding protein [Betaproteobacteria bacterium]